MPATISAFWKNASTAKRAVTVVIAAAIAALAIGGITFGAMSAGGDDNASALAPTPTASGPTPTPRPPTPTVEEVLRYFAAILPTATATPEYRGGGTGGGGTGGGGGTYRPSGG